MRRFLNPLSPYNYHCYRSALPVQFTAVGTSHVLRGNKEAEEVARSSSLARFLDTLGSTDGSFGEHPPSSSSSTVGPAAFLGPPTSISAAFSTARQHQQRRFVRYGCRSQRGAPLDSQRGAARLPAAVARTQTVKRGPCCSRWRKGDRWPLKVQTKPTSVRAAAWASCGVPSVPPTTTTSSANARRPKLPTARRRLLSAGCRPANKLENDNAGDRSSGCPSTKHRGVPSVTNPKPPSSSLGRLWHYLSTINEEPSQGKATSFRRRMPWSLGRQPLYGHNVE
ncbi:hypothetical protein MTO96_020973 [Rhipicephalus appendiculatus]